MRNQRIDVQDPKIIEAQKLTEEIEQLRESTDGLIEKGKDLRDLVRKKRKVI